jgi:hypothetical protein
LLNRTFHQFHHQLDNDRPQNILRRSPQFLRDSIVILSTRVHTTLQKIWLAPSPDSQRDCQLNFEDDVQSPVRSPLLDLPSGRGWACGRPLYELLVPKKYRICPGGKVHKRLQTCRVKRRLFFMSNSVSALEKIPSQARPDACWLTSCMRRGPGRFHLSIIPRTSSTAHHNSSFFARQEFCSNFILLLYYVLFLVNRSCSNLT